MDYHIDDAYGYIGDLGKNTSFELLFDFLVKHGAVFQELLENRYTEDLGGIKKGLKGLSADDVELNHDLTEFREMVSRCRMILMINDGCNEYYQFDTGDQGGYGSIEQRCGLDIFDDFIWQDISHAKPPEKPGVFVIKVQKTGTDEIVINGELTGFFSRICWQEMRNSYETRLDKIVHMSSCPILYIGSTTTNTRNPQTLASRYKELACCHPITFSVWALLYYHWKLDFGWKVHDNPRKCSTELNKRYLRHHGQMPMMAEREESEILTTNVSRREY